MFVMHVMILVFMAQAHKKKRGQYRLRNLVGAGHFTDRHDRHRGFRESFSIPMLAGLALIIAGVVLLNL
jgi:hypothetical protein